MAAILSDGSMCGLLHSIKPLQSPYINQWIDKRINTKYGQIKLTVLIIWGPFKDRAHLSTFKFFIFEKFSCFIVLVVFLVIVQSSELISV